MRVPQGAHVDRHGGAYAGQHGEPKVTGGFGPGRHRGGQRPQAESGRGFGWGRQLPDGARLQRRSVAVLVRVQGADASSNVDGERVGGLDVALPAGFGGAGGAQQLLRVLEVGEVGYFPLAEGTFPKGCISVDSHH